MRNRNFFIRLVLFGCLVCMIPVILVGTFSYIQSSRQVQQQVNHSELQYVRQVKSNIEQILITLNHTLTNLLDSTVMEAASKDKLAENSFQLYNNLRSEISHLQSFDTMVDDVILFNKSQDWLLKNIGLYRFSAHPDHEQLLTKMNMKTDTDWVLLNKNASTDTFTSRNCNYSIALLKKYPVLRSEKQGMALAILSACQLSGLVYNEQKAEEVMVIDRDQRIVLHRDHEKIGRLFAEQFAFDDPISFEGQSGQIHASFEQHPYTLTYYASEFNEWTYLSVVSLDELMRESRSIGWFTLSVGLSVILLSLACVFLVTRRLYSPLHRLVNSILHARVEQANDSGSRDELQLIDRHIQELFSSNSHLEKQSKQFKQQIRAVFLNRLYAGMLRPPEIEEQLKDFALDEQLSNWKWMNVLLVRIDTLDNTRYENKDMELLLFAMANMVEEQVPREQRFPPIWFDRTIVLLAGSQCTDQAQLRDEMYRLTESLKHLIEQYLGLSVSIGISLPFSDVLQSGRAYTEAAEALKHRLKLGKGVIIPYSSVNYGQPSLAYDYPSRLENELLDAVKMGDEEEALILFTNWLEKAVQDLQAPGDYQTALVRLLNRLLTLRQESGIAWEQIAVRNSVMYDELLRMQMIEEIEQWFRDRLIIPLLQVFKDRRDSQYQTLSEELIDLIRQHFERDLTLEECAQMLHYNANYLSGVFKRETGSTFSEYMTHYRFQMAKKWLLETDMPIKEIAASLHYNNSQNFIRSFRKQEGMTPGQYRALGQTDSP